MAYIFVNKSRLRSFAQQSRQVGSKIKNINNDFSKTGRSLDWDIKSSQDINKIISQIENEFDKYARTFDKIAEFFETAYNEYTKLDSESIENNERALTPSTITSECKTIAEDIMQWFRDNPAAASILLVNPITAPAALLYAGKAFVDAWDSLDGKSGNVWSDEVTDGNVKAGLYGPGYEFTKKSLKAYLGKASAEAKTDYASAGVNAYVGKVEAKKDFKFNFLDRSHTEKEYKDGRIETKDSWKAIEAKADLGVKATGLSVDGNVKVGNDDLGLGVKGSGDVGVASASGSAVLDVGSEGVDAYAKGELFVAAAQTEAKGTISILGLDITGKAGLSAGSLGVEGKAGIEKNKFVLEGKAGAIFGGNLGVEIGFNDTGWKNTVKNAENLYKETRDLVEKVL